MGTKMEPGKKTLVIGFVAVVILAVIFIILGIIHWTIENFVLNNDISYIGYIILGSLALLTTTHLWSRLPEFERGTSIRNLFLLMGVSFIVLSGVFLFNIFDALAGWTTGISLSDIVNSAVPDDIIFNLFDIAQVRMGIADVLLFEFMMVAVSFYMMPVEIYVKNRKPWFTVSMWACVIGIPFLVVFKGNDIVLAIATVSIVFFVLINFIYLFYLYITLAKVSAGKMKTASILVAFGLITMIFVWVSGWAIQELTTNDLVPPLIQFGIGFSSIVLFNAGFYIMRS
ncbi:MAG: hypothetical protein ACFFCS_24295 [Candidatus Hodarchaeota archaeon]